MKDLNLDPPSSESQDISLYEKLKQDILYLNTLKPTVEPQFFVESKRLMEVLTKAFKKEQQKNLYLPWIKFLGVAHKLYKANSIFRKPQESDYFKTEMREIIHSLLLAQIDRNQELDWRIARKMLAYQEIFPEDSLVLPTEQDLVTPLNNQLEEALNRLEGTTDQQNFIRKPMIKLLEMMKDKNKETQKSLRKAILIGRFDKKTFELQNTIIIGEDGGLYLLLNTVDQEQREYIKRIVGQEYLSDKISEDGKVLIGKGGFGKVRFAFNLLERETKKLICVKKTRNFSVLSNDSFQSSIKIVTDNALVDYFTNDIVEIVNAPRVIDMAIVSGKDILPKHKKGYVMMELIPHNTGTRVFNPGEGEVTEYQKWKHQKPYILDVLDGMAKLLKKGVAMMDIKPDNTLYNKDLYQTTFVDLAGTVKPKDLSNFNPRENIFQSTCDFQAPEQKSQTCIDLNKSIPYSCGKLIESITTITDYPNPQEINQLICELTKEEVGDRMSIQTAIEEVTKMGNDEYKEHIFDQYIKQMKERLSSTNHLFSIGLHNNIKLTKELLIPLELTVLDPCQNSSLKSFPFDQILDDFCSSNQQTVFLLLGATGAGKSVALQLRFIDAIEKWKVGESLPIYFNLANGIDLEQVLKKMNQELKTGLSVKSLRGKNVHLFVDNLDVWPCLDQDNKEQLLQCFFEKLGQENTKVFLTCHSDYPFEDHWLSPPIETMAKYYIVPLESPPHP